MDAIWATARCLRCGRPLAARLPATPGARWVTCAHCRAPVPVVPPTDPPPIFSWEVYPLVYPPLPTLRPPSGAPARLAAVALVAAVVVLAGVAVALAGSGAEALGAGTFRLSGTVQAAGGGGPIFNAQVTLASESGWIRSIYTGVSGTFAFSGIPAGGARLNVSAVDYAGASFALFFSPSYRATGAGTGGLVVTLAEGPPTNATVAFESPFTDLEGFVSSLWSAAALLLLGAIVAAAGAVAAARGRRPAVGVAGGVAAVLAPLGLDVLSITTAFPLAIVPAIAAIGLGVTAAVLETVPLWEAGRVPDSE